MASATGGLTSRAVRKSAVPGHGRGPDLPPTRASGAARSLGEDRRLSGRSRPPPERGGAPGRTARGGELAGVYRTESGARAAFAYARRSLVPAAYAPLPLGSGSVKKRASTCGEARARSERCSHISSSGGSSTSTRSAAPTSAEAASPGHRVPLPAHMVSALRPPVLSRARQESPAFAPWSTRDRRRSRRAAPRPACRRSAPRT
jgi:hypothetical protein